MTDLIQSLSSETGAAPDMIRNALGAIFGFLRKHLDPGLVDQIEAHVPGASELPQGAETAERPGLLGTLSGVVGKVFGGRVGEGADLISHLSGTGLSPENIKIVLSKVVAYLEAHLPPELFEQIKAHFNLPVGEPTA
jgi:uncharacterized protein (DUF2267 family)